MAIRFFFYAVMMVFIHDVHAQQKLQALPVIFDTDMGPDYDDVGAITLLHAYADSGEVNILATIASTNYEGVAGVLNVFNTYFGRPEIAIGVPKGRALSLRDRQHWSDTLLLKYSHAVKANAEAEDAVAVYRKVLSSQPDISVTIITVGFLTNLANLLRSAADNYSPLDGKALVEKKVKRLVAMAGSFPSGSEFNLNQDPASSAYVFQHWNRPILFSGVEIGRKIKTGLPLVNDTAIHKSPVQDVFRIAIPLDRADSAGRMSWDETAVLVAVKGLKPWYTEKSGTIQVAADGSNGWLDSGSLQHYLVELSSPAIVEQLIPSLIALRLNSA